MLGMVGVLCTLLGGGGSVDFGEPLSSAMPLSTVSTVDCRCGWSRSWSGVSRFRISAAGAARPGELLREFCCSSLWQTILGMLALPLGDDPGLLIPPGSSIDDPSCIASFLTILGLGLTYVVGRTHPVASFISSYLTCVQRSIVALGIFIATLSGFGDAEVT